MRILCYTERLLDFNEGARPNSTFQGDCPAGRQLRHWPTQVRVLGRTAGPLQTRANLHQPRTGQGFSHEAPYTLALTSRRDLFCGDTAKQ